MVIGAKQTGVSLSPVASDGPRGCLGAGQRHGRSGTWRQADAKRNTTRGPPGGAQRDTLATHREQMRLESGLVERRDHTRCRRPAAPGSGCEQWLACSDRADRRGRPPGPHGGRRRGCGRVVGWRGTPGGRGLPPGRSGSSGPPCSRRGDAVRTSVRGRLELALA